MKTIIRFLRPEVINERQEWLTYIKLLVLIFLSLTTIHSNAQDNTDVINGDSLLLPDVLPAFPGGPAEWQKFLQRNLRPDVPIDNGASSGEYRVQVRFIVEVDGSISSIEALTKLGYGMEEEVIRVISKSGKWTPGLLKGEPIKSYMVQSIGFEIKDE